MMSLSKLKLNHLVLISCVLSFTGCSSLPFADRNTTLPSVQAELTVTPSSQPGTYTLIGKTDFPDRSPLRIAAVRYLYPTTPISQTLGSKPTYAILAYATTTVEKGNWTVPLTVWQTAPNGQYQESWQLTQPELKLNLKPADNLVFVATLAPGDKADNLQQLEQNLLKNKKSLSPEIIRRSGADDRFLQLVQIIEAKLPTGSTQAPTQDPNDLNGGWGNRFLMPDEPPNPNNLEFPENRRTNAKPDPKEFMR
jgi:hypothetical protein